MRAAKFDRTLSGMSHSRTPVTLLAALVSLAVLALVALSVGRFPLDASDVWSLLWARVSGGAHHLSPQAETVLFDLRGPRILAAIVIGAAWSGAGAVFQNLFRNPLVSPDILGVSSGAALGAVLAIFLSLPLLAIQGFAFAGGLLAVALVYFIGNAVRGSDPILALILTGVVVGTLFSSCIALLKTLADPYHQLPAITFWLLGSLSSVSPKDLWIAIPLVLLGLVPIFLLRWRMNLLSLSDDEASALGVNVKGMRIAIVACATLITAAAVAISGIIGWIGLLIPHAARLIAGPEFSRLLPLSLVLGACYLLAVDTLARTMASMEIPPGVLTALIGTPLFLWLLAATHSRKKVPA